MTRHNVALMQRRKSKVSTVWWIVVALFVSSTKTSAQELSNELISDNGGNNVQLTELPGGSFVGERTLRLAESPYILRQDMEIELGAKLIVDPGVHLHFSPMVGMTVRGAIIAVVSYINLICKILFKKRARNILPLPRSVFRSRSG